MRHHAATENAQGDSSIFLARFDTLRWIRRDLTETLWIEALRLSVYLDLLPDTPEVW